MTARKEAQKNEMEGNLLQKQMYNEQKAELNKRLGQNISSLQSECHQKDMMIVELKKMSRKASDREEGTLKNLN